MGNISAPRSPAVVLPFSAHAQAAAPTVRRVRDHCVRHSGRAVRAGVRADDHRVHAHPARNARAAQRMSVMRAAQVLLTIIAGPVFAGSWETGKPLPHPIAGHAALIDREGVVWVAGGSAWHSEEKKIVAAIWRLGQGGYWQDVSSVVGGYAHGAAVAVDNAWWLIGGLEGSGPSRAIRRIELPEVRSVLV